MEDFSKSDIRAAVAAGLITEAQAAGLLALAQERVGMRQNMAAEDEPFEFFKGFSEIFVTVGLALCLVAFLPTRCFSETGLPFPSSVWRLHSGFHFISSAKGE